MYFWFFSAVGAAARPATRRTLTNGRDSPPRPIGDGYALPRCVDAVNVVALAGQIICGEAVAAADVQNRGAVGREQPLDVFAEEFVVECGLSIAPAEFAVVCCHGDRGIVRTQFPQR